jgi:hypothetical protein
MHGAQSGILSKERAGRIVRWHRKAGAIRVAFETKPTRPSTERLLSRPRHRTMPVAIGGHMFSSWYGVAMLAMESSSVVCLRLMKMSEGGDEAQLESQLMVNEKIAASMEAAVTLMTGGSMDSVITRYREQVAANTDRLTSSMFGPFAGCVAPGARSV